MARGGTPCLGYIDRFFSRNNMGNGCWDFSGELAIATLGKRGLAASINDDESKTLLATCPLTGLNRRLLLSPYRYDWVTSGPVGHAQEGLLSLLQSDEISLCNR